MKLRRFNALLSLLTTVLLIDHGVFCSVLMLSRYSVGSFAPFMPRLLAVLTVVHAFISIAEAFIGRRGAEKRKCKAYPKMNRSTELQRITGVLMLLMLGLHILGAVNVYRPKLLHAVFQPLFFAVVAVHLSVSLSKAFITLGIGNAKFIKAVDLFAKVLGAVIFVAATIGFYLCLFGGIAE